MGNLELKDSDRFKTAVSQEEARLGQLHPTPEDIPTCMSVFDDFLSCNSMYSLFHSYIYFKKVFLTHAIENFN
jgi:hypothetical protein